MHEYLLFISIYETLTGHYLQRIGRQAQTA